MWMKQNLYVKFKVLLKLHGKVLLRTMVLILIPQI